MDYRRHRHRSAACVVRNGLFGHRTGAVRPLLPRSFANLSEAETENGQSRIYLLQHDASGALGVVLNKGEVAPGVTEGGPVGRADTIELVDARGHARVFQGYAGWAPGQLERELRMGAWRVQPGTAHDVLDP